MSSIIFCLIVLWLFSYTKIGNFLWSLIAFLLELFTGLLKVAALLLKALFKISIGLLKVLFFFMNISDS